MEKEQNIIENTCDIRGWEWTVIYAVFKERITARASRQSRLTLSQRMEVNTTTVAPEKIQSWFMFVK